MIAIVCGYGSIGKKYVKILKKKNFKVVIFDPKLKKIDSKEFIFVKKFKDINNSNVKISKSTIGIISSLSGNHLSNFVDLSNIGVNRILIEKPITDKLYDYKNIIKIRDKKKLFVSTHYKWRAEGLFKILLKIQKKYKTGKPFIFNCLAGSCCIATGAIHWIDFFSNFYNKNEDLQIFSNYKFNKINPRGKMYNQIGGNLYLKPKKTNIEANFHFSNNSRLSPEITLLYRSHKIKIDIYGNYEVYRTPKNFDNLKITRYAKTNLIKKGIMKISKNSINIVLDNLLKSKKPLINLEDSFYALQILFLSFLSNKFKKTINLKKFEQIFKKSNYYKKSFKFT